ncbi:hypothetical protein ACOME3_010600 [Neoechinorhynchus agilis]
MDVLCPISSFVSLEYLTQQPYKTKPDSLISMEIHDYEDPPLKPQDEIQNSQDLFQNVRFCVLAPIDKSVQSCLLLHGATFNGPFLNEQVTHVICDCPDKERLLVASNLFKIPPVVTSDWVRWSLRCNTILPVAPFSISHGADQFKRIFGGLTFGFVTSRHQYLGPIDLDDQLKLKCMIVYYGGRCSQDLYQCNYLISSGLLEPHHEISSKVRIVTPQFVIECINQRCLMEWTIYRPMYRIVTVTGTVSDSSTRCSGREFEPISGYLFLSNFRFIFDEEVEICRGRKFVLKLMEEVRSNGASASIGCQNLKNEPSNIIVCENQSSESFKMFMTDTSDCKLVTSSFVEDCLKLNCLRTPWLLHHLPCFHSCLRSSRLPLRNCIVLIRGCGMDEYEVTAIETLVKLLGGKVIDRFLRHVSVIVSAGHGYKDESDEIKYSNVRTVSVGWLICLFLGIKADSIDCTKEHSSVLNIYQKHNEFMLASWICKPTFLDGYDLFDLNMNHSKPLMNPMKSLVQRKLICHASHVLAFDGFDFEEEKRLFSVAMCLAYTERPIGSRRFDVTSLDVPGITHLICKDFGAYSNALDGLLGNHWLHLIDTFKFNFKRIEFVRIVLQLFDIMKTACDPSTLPGIFSKCFYTLHSALSLKKLALILASTWTELKEHKYILNLKWLEDSLAEGRFIDPDTKHHYLNREVFLFTYRLDIDSAFMRPRPIFEKFTFACTMSVKPSQSLVENIIENGGGMVMDWWNLPESSADVQSILISCEEDINILGSFDLVKHFNVQPVQSLFRSIFLTYPDFETYRYTENSVSLDAFNLTPRM